MVKLIVYSMFFKELFVCPFFCNAVLGQYENAVGIADRGEAVRDGKRRAAFRKSV